MLFCPWVSIRGVTTRVCCCVLQCRASSENIWNSLDSQSLHDPAFNLLLLTTTLLRTQTTAAWQSFLCIMGTFRWPLKCNLYYLRKAHVNCTVVCCVTVGKIWEAKNTTLSRGTVPADVWNNSQVQYILHTRVRLSAKLAVVVETQWIGTVIMPFFLRSLIIVATLLAAVITISFSQGKEE